MQTEQLITFFTAHWQLSLLFVVLLLSLIGVEIRNKLVGIPGFSPAQVTQSINHDAATVLDFRNKEQFMLGHILGAINRPWSEFQKQPQVDCDKQKPVIAICENGQTASKAAILLRNAGFSQVRILQGGLMSWRSAGLPLTKKGAK